MNNTSKYNQPTITVDTSPKIQEVAATLQAQLEDPKDSMSATLAVRAWLNKNAYDTSTKPPKPYRTAKSLIESRSTPASQLVEAPIASCGSQATLGAALLRAMGFAVKLVHGTHPQSTQHAWIEIYDQATSKWIGVDFTGYGQGKYGQLTKDHQKEIICTDWYDIKETLGELHLQNTQS